MDTAFINKTYAGSETVYSLDVKGDEVIVEYLDVGKSTVLHGHKSAQISLPGDIDQISKALALIASLCTPKADIERLRRNVRFVPIADIHQLAR